MKLDFSSLAQPAAKTWGQAGTSGTPAVAGLWVSPVTQIDLGTAGDKLANAVSEAVSERAPMVPAAEACPPVSPACPHGLDDGNINTGVVSPPSPLVPLKNIQATTSPADEDDADTRKQQGTDPSTCNGCGHMLPYGTCGEPVAAGLAHEFGIVWAPEGHGAGCPAFNGPAPLKKKDQLCRLKKGVTVPSHTVFWDDIEIDPLAPDENCVDHLDELQEF